jgi:hypothetical protein
MRNFKVDMLSALIDGPIDADKADYIIRDSSQCRIPYGNQLDIDRLLHVLTIAVMRGQYRVTMGVYEKGKASAESFALARYLLFSAVYWHHTSRIIKAMVQYSTAVALGDDALAAKDKVRDKKVIESVQVPLIAFITSLSPPFDRTIRGPMPKPEIDKTRVDAAPDSVVLNALASATNPRTAARDWYPGISWTDWLMLQWIRDYLAKDQPKSRALINGILGRHLYKRIATFSRKNPDDGALLEKLDEMSWIDRKNLCAGVDERIRKIFFEKWSHGKIETESLQSKEKIEQIFDENMVILIDIPNPKAKRGRRSDLPLTVVPELRQKTYSQEAEEPYASDNWVDTLMDSIGPVRVICHPDLEKAIGAMYAQDDRHFEIRKIILAALDELGN